MLVEPSYKKAYNGNDKNLHHVKDKADKLQAIIELGCNGQRPISKQEYCVALCSMDHG